MVCTRYRPKDLKLARRHIVMAARRIAEQERVIRTLSLKGAPAGAAYALLDRLYDNQRRKLARLKLIEAMLNESMALPALRQACQPPGKTKTHLRLVSPAAANSGSPDRLLQRREQESPSPSLVLDISIDVVSGSQVV